MEIEIDLKVHVIVEITLHYRPVVKPSKLPKVKGSKDAYRILIESWDEDTLDFVEQFKVILLNRANRVLGIYTASTGGVSGTVADPKLILALAVKANATAIILAHNHPSGNITASRSNIELTQKIKMAGKFLDMSVLDHLIISSEEFFSFADDGAM